MPFALNESTRFISPTKTPSSSPPACRWSRRRSPMSCAPTARRARRDRQDPLEAVRKAEALLERPRQPWLSRVDRHLAAGSWDKTWAAMHKLMLEGLERLRGPGASAPSYIAAAE